MKLSDLLVTKETFDSDKYQDLLASSKYERMVWDDFRDGGLIVPTSMTFTQNGYTFLDGQVLESTNLIDPAVVTDLTECFIFIDFEDSGTPTIEVTADGTNWEEAFNNNIHIFDNRGTDLRLRFTSEGSGYLKVWSIMYAPHTISLSETDNGIITLDTLPVFDSFFKGKVIYVSSEDTYYAGFSSTWVQIFDNVPIAPS